MNSLLALLFCLATAAPQGTDPRVEAERLARSGAHAEALERFQAIVAANPDDVPARMWIGRLHLSMGHPARAAAVFESVVATQPQNVDALVGLGRAQAESGRAHEASDALSRAEALAGDRIDVLEAQGRFHARQGRSTLAIAYYDRALAAEPGNTAIRVAADLVRASRAHRVSVGYDLQAFRPSAGEMHAGTIDANFHVSDLLRLFARGQVQSFENADDTRGGGGLEWAIRHDLGLRAGALIGSDPVWLPSTDLFAEATLARRAAHWTFGVRFYDFDGANLWLAGPGVSFDVTPRVGLDGRYLRGRTEVDNRTSSTSDNWMVGVRVRATERVRAAFAYHRGIDRLDWMTRDRIFAGDANTLAADVSGDLTPFVTLSGGYDFQERPGDLRVHRGRGWLTFRF